MTENFANEYQTTLSAGIDASQTSISVTSATGAPAASFRVRVDNEYMLVTEVSGTTWTVERGVEDSTAASHSSDSTVTHVLTAGGLSQAIRQRVVNTDGDPGTMIYVGFTDPSTLYTMQEGDVWIERDS